jgi:hypothetical protein
MKLTENTLNTLKNFSTINQSILLRKGKVQKTLHPDQVILAEAAVENDFPIDFGIYDLNQFLGTLGAMNDPDIEFSDTGASISDRDGFKVLYAACSPSQISSPPNKDLVIEDVDAAFQLSHAALKKMLTLSNMNNLSNISVVGEAGSLYIQGHENANDTSNTIRLSIGTCEKDFIATFKAEYLILLPFDYSVELNKNSFAKFTNKEKELTYTIALEV